MLFVRSLFIVSTLAITLAMNLKADQPEGSHPATTAEAASAIDLETFPMMNGGKPTQTRRLATLGYIAKGDPRGAYAFQKNTLEARGWKELPGAYLSDLACSGWFGKDGFTVSVTTSPSTGAKSTEMVNVRLMNHGNVDLGKLPVPPNSKPLYSFAGTVAFVTEVSPKETAVAVARLLTAQGWRPYGNAGESQFFKQNAVRLAARCTAAPGQGGKTMIQLSSEQLSADLPAPPALLQASYADSTKTLSLDVDMSADSLAAFYRDVLGTAGWKSTTDKLLKEGAGELMIFRNEAKDIAFLTMHTFQGGLRAELKHQTDAEFAEEVRRAEADDAKRKAESARYAKAAAAEAAKKLVTVTIALPAGAEHVERTRNQMTFKLPAGSAKPAVQTIHNALVGQSWMDERTSLGQLTGSVRLSKGADVSLTITYVDTGLEDATVTIVAFGAKIDDQSAK